MDLADAVQFDPETGLVPAVVQSAEDGRVLVLAYMDREALERTAETGRVTFWSRSREELWEKGVTSGNWLEAVELRSDCDGDALLVRARPHGPTCHTGEASCFDAGDHREVSAPPSGAGGKDGRGPPAGGGEGEGAPGRADASGGREPTAAYAGTTDAGPAGPGGAGAPPAAEGAPDLSAAGPSPAPVLASVLEELVRVVADRDRERPEGSYTTSLLEGGPSLAARKVGEEALETALSAVDEPERLAEESADLLYHLVVLWRAAGLPPDAVGRELSGRRGP